MEKSNSKNWKLFGKKMAFLGMAGMVLAIGGSRIEAASATIKIDNTHFPDKNLQKAIKQYDTDKDGKLSVKEKKKITYLGTLDGVINLQGIEYLDKLKKVSVGVKKNLQIPDTYKGSLEIIPPGKKETITLNGGENVTELSFYMGSAQKVNFKNTMPKVKSLSIYMAYIKSIDYKNIPNLDSIYTNSGAGIDSLDFSGMKKLKTISIRNDDCSKNVILKVENCPQLKTLNYYSENSSNKKISIKSCPKLETLHYSNYKGSKKQELDLSSCPKLKDIMLDKSKTVKQLYKLKNLATLDIAQSLENHQFSKLKSLTYNGKEKTLSLKNFPSLKSLNIGKNSGIKELDLSKGSLKSVSIECPIETITVPENFLKISKSFNTKSLNKLNINVKQGKSISLLEYLGYDASEDEEEDENKQPAIKITGIDATGISVSETGLVEAKTKSANGAYDNKFTMVINNQKISVKVCVK